MRQWERARSETQKQAREQEILSAARGLLLSHPFEAISFSKIAVQLSFTRANLYKYFQSKEEIFLALLAHEVEAFGKKLLSNTETLIENLEEDVTAEHFINFWVSSLNEEKHFLMLLSMTGSILEKNCSDHSLLKSKKSMFHATSTYFIPCVQHFFPYLDIEASAWFLQVLIINANGLFPFCGLNAHQQGILSEAGLGSLVHQFDQTYTMLVAQYIKYCILPLANQS